MESEQRTLDHLEAKQLLIEGEHPREIGDDDTNVVERKLSHSDENDAVSGKATHCRAGDQPMVRWRPVGAAPRSTPETRAR